MADKICPILVLSTRDHDALCMKEECAWWQVYYGNDEKKRFGECSIRALANLFDMVR